MIATTFEENHRSAVARKFHFTAKQIKTTVGRIHIFCFVLENLQFLVRGFVA